MAAAKLSADKAVVVRDRAVLGGRPVFRGTRVQAEILFENLAEGYSLDEILENFPTLDRADLRQAILQACELIRAAAPEMPSSAHRETARARVPG
jgi:uncharacterized protein (DUF433 family)